MTRRTGRGEVGIATLMAALLFTITCSDAVGPGPDVRLEVSLSEEVVGPGEVVQIWITVHNPGEQAVSLGERCAPLGFRVIDEDGRRVGPAFNWESSFVCIGEIDNTVPARDSKIYGFLWSPVFDYGSSNVPLTPGTYRIFAGIAGEPLRPPLSEKVAIQVRAE
jgi:hypothetical protein